MIINNKFFTFCAFRLSRDDLRNDRTIVNSPFGLDPIKS